MKKKVLVFPCGSEIGLEIYRSLRFSKHFEVFGASSVDDHGEFTFSNYIPDVPFVEDESFIGKLNEIIKQYQIDYIFPAHDSVVLKLAQHKDDMPAAIITSPLQTCETARSKRKTYETLKDVVTVPRIYSSEEALDLPVFLKPDVGQGSKGTLLANTIEEVKMALAKDPSLLVLEYLPGKEYTVDCFTDHDGKLVHALPRERVRTTNGISVSSKSVDDHIFADIAERINQAVDFRGVWFFQLKQNNVGEMALLEVAPRVAGTMAVSRMKGANLPLLSLYDFMDVKLNCFINNFDVQIDRALTAKYRLNIEYVTVYVDFDDTLIFEDGSNYLLIALLYKFIEEKKEIVLVTKHVKEVKETLSKHRISELIFDRIITLSKEDEKSAHLSTNAIFIDDSFSERKAVHDNLGIPVFDVSEAVELL